MVPKELMWRSGLSEMRPAVRSEPSIAQKVGGERVGALVHHNADDHGRWLASKPNR